MIFMFRILFLALFLGPTAAAAQGWETFHHDLGAGAAVCPYDDSETGDFFCFAVACLEAGGPAYLRIAVAGQNIASNTPPLQIVVDGQPVARLFLNKIGDGDMQDFGIPVDAARDTPLIEALKAGTRGMLVFGTGPSGIIQQISLRGSHSALDAVPLLCDRRPITLATDDAQ